MRGLEKKTAAVRLNLIVVLTGIRLCRPLPKMRGVKGMLPLGCLPLWGREGVTLILVVNESANNRKNRISPENGHDARLPQAYTMKIVGLFSY
jgi:hypothetical protein